MGKAEMALADTEARKARPTTKPYKLGDSGGLFLAVMPPGGKLWRWKYRFEGREKLMALGSYPEVSLSGGAESSRRWETAASCWC
jgi:hypothetical protein